MVQQAILARAYLAVISPRLSYSHLSSSPYYVCVLRTYNCILAVNTMTLTIYILVAIIAWILTADHS